ncbi:MAG: condensation domain-containing protein, partial [Thermoanaerobaculia bacterium]
MADRPADSRSALSSEQRTALERRVREAASSAGPRVRISRRADPAAPAPLSSAQQRLWVLDQLVPGNSFYNVPRTFRIEGALDSRVLAAALEETVRRHESLRTTFENRDGQPVQVIGEAGPFSLSEVSLEGRPPDEREAAALELAREDAERPFDLARGPLLRATLLRLSENAHLLHITVHHIVTDGWSMDVLWRELSISYEARLGGRSPGLAPLPVQYADFCRWQQEWLRGESASAQVSHWAERLKGAAPLELPVDHPRPTTPTFRGTYQTRVVSREVVEKLRSLSRAEGATLYMAILAAFEIFLQRHTGQDDVSIATPIAGRQFPELEGLIGFFANTVVIRGDLSGQPTAREVIRRVREAALDAYAHQDVPLEKLVEALRPERSLSQNPIAQVVCVLQNEPASELVLPGARVAPIELLTNTARFDLELHARERRGELACTIMGSSELFDGETVERLLERFVVLLEAIAENPDRPAAALDLLPAGERSRLLSEWNPPTRDFSTGRQLHEFFQRRAAEAPESTAVEFESARLSYSELNVRSNQLAWHLKTLGVGPDVLVAVCLDRSLEMMVALLGILKAGGAYVPLDPAYPADRLAFMLEDAGAPVLVTSQRLKGALPERAGLRVCLLEGDFASLEGEQTHDPPVTGSPDDLAYVIYTSGSTGKPKGVLVTHRNVDRLFAATEPWFGFDERDVWTLFH